MKKKSSYIKLMKQWGVILLLLLGVSIIVVDVVVGYRYFNLRIARMRMYYIEQQKQLIKWEVDHFISSNEMNRKKIIAHTKESIKCRVDDACNLVKNIYMQNKDDKTPDEIKKTVVDVLRTVRFSEGRGHYFIYSTEGIKVLCKSHPELEGQNFLEKKDSSGKYYIKEMIIAAQEANEKGCEYSWFKLDDKEKKLKKISYIKIFKPYGWVIGVGLYANEIEKEVKRDFMQRANEGRYGKNGYFVVGDWSGVLLAHGAQPDLVGSNLWNVTDCNGTKLIQKIIAVSLYKNGGYVKYYWRKPDTKEEQAKISFAKGVKNMDCFLVAGVYLDDIESRIAIQQDLLNAQVRKKILLCVMFITIIVIVFILLFNGVNMQFGRDLNEFIAFFKTTAHTDKPVDHNSMKFSEFDELASSANEMLLAKFNAQNRLKDEKEQLAVTLGSIGDGVITTDTDGRIEMMNIVAEDVTGWKLKDAKGKVLTEVFHIIHEHTREIIDNPVNKVLEFRGTVEIASDSILISKDGVEYYISDSAAPIKCSDGSIRGVVLVFRDITVSRKTDSILANAKKLESIGVLAGGIAHDFNNILTGLFGNIELSKTVLSPEHLAYSYIETAEQALDRATNLTKQLLTFAKGGIPILGAVSLKDVVSESVKFNLAGSNIKAIFDLPDDLWEVKADKGQLNQVVANLTINAKQSMKNGGTLSFRAMNVKELDDEALPDLTGDFVKLLVKDEGCGIVKKDLDKIFDPYFSTKRCGSGLGLATVRSIIDKHNGYIQVDSIPDVGTTFTILLPVEKNMRKDTFSTKINIVENHSTILGHILFMDDEETIVKISKAMLSTCGYTCESACDGVDALEKYIVAEKNGNPFDVVIMDLTIPGGMGGKEAIDKFIVFNPNIKVIVTSGYSVDPILANYADYGFKGRLVKPFRMQELARELAHVMAI